MIIIELIEASDVIKKHQRKKNPSLLKEWKLYMNHLKKEERRAKKLETTNWGGGNPFPGLRFEEILGCIIERCEYTQLDMEYGVITEIDK